MGLPDLACDVTAVFIPIFSGQTVAVDFQLKDAVQRAELDAVFRNAPGVELVDEPGKKAYPNPVEAAENELVFVGRLRKDGARDQGWRFVASWDNLRVAASDAFEVARSFLDGGVL